MIALAHVGTSCPTLFLLARCENTCILPHTMIQYSCHTKRGTNEYDLRGGRHSTTADWVVSYHSQTRQSEEISLCQTQRGWRTQGHLYSTSGRTRNNDIRTGAIHTQYKEIDAGKSQRTILAVRTFLVDCHPHWNAPISLCFALYYTCHVATLQESIGSVRRTRLKMNKHTMHVSQDDHILVPSYIRTHFPDLTFSDKWFYVCLCEICLDEKTSTYSLRQLRQSTGLSPAALCRTIPNLVKAGLIEATKKRRDSGGAEVWHITLIDILREDVETLSKNYEQQSVEHHTPELYKLNAQIERTRSAGLTSDLSLGEWLVTLEYFDNKCAYCGGPYEIIEHFIPVTLGGGTTKTNCVPACASCNVRKKEHHPFLMPSSVGMSEAIGSIKIYIDLCRE